MLVVVAMVLERRCIGLTPAQQFTVVLALFGAGTLGNYRGDILPDKDWEAGAPAIERWIEQSRAHQPTLHTIVAISPDPWGVNLPGREITGYQLASNPPAGLRFGVFYAIVSKLSGKVLDVSDLSMNNGAAIQQWEFLGGMNQQWLLKPASVWGMGNCDPAKLKPTNFCKFEIKARSSGLILDVASGFIGNGARIQQWCIGPPGCTSVSSPNSNQEWVLRPVGDGYFKIISASSGLLLEVSGGAGARNNGNRIDQWADIDGDNQLWRFVPVMPY